MLTHVVSTVHGTCRLLVAWKVYAHHHFFFSIWGMNSSFVNVVLVSPIFYEKEIRSYLYLKDLVGCPCRDNSFANMFRMDTNSLYVLDSKSAESNTSIFSSFGCIANAIQCFLQKYSR